MDPVAAWILGIIGGIAAVVTIGGAGWYAARRLFGGTASAQQDVPRPPPTGASVGGAAAGGDIVTTADRGSVAFSGHARDVTMIQQGVGVDTEARERLARVEQQLEELQKKAVAPPPGAPPADTQALAAQATDRTERLLAEAIDLQQRHKEREAIERLLTAYDMEMPPAAKAQLHILLGNGFLRLSELEEAEGHYRQALDASRAANIREYEAAAVGNLGLVYADQGELARAEEHHRQALQIHREIGNRLGEANQLGNLGIVYLQQGDLARAGEHHQQALQIDREIGHRPGQAQDLDSLGNVYADRGEREEACRLLKEAAAIYEEMGAGGPGPETVRRKLQELGCE